MKLGAAGPETDLISALAIRAWNMMRGIDWTALPIVAEIVGFEDRELLVHLLIKIRDKQDGR